MRTPIDIPEDLLHRAKVVAAQRKQTLKELVLQGLDYVTRHPVRDVGTERQVALRALLKKMEAHNTKPMEPLERKDLYER